MLRLTILLVAPLVSAQAACTNPPKSPAQGGPPWVEVTTERFLLHTDVDEAAARTSAIDFERAYQYLEQVAFPGFPPPAQRLDVVLFRSEGEFHRFWPRDMAGFYMDRPPQDIERAPTMVLYGDLTGDTRVVFLHELTHRFIARAYGWAPPWMQEGLADYFSTMRIDGARAILGEVPNGRLIARNLVPTVQELVTADRAAFYGEWTGEDYGSLHRARYYAGAYALVHLLRNGPDMVRRRFDVFVDAMNDGARAAHAWSAAFGGVPADLLEKLFDAHLAGAATWDLFAAHVEPVPSALAEQARTMTDAEVHVLWARLLRASDDDEQKIRAQLDQAFAQSPGSAQVAYARGCLELARRHVAEARALFEQALNVEPDNPRYLYAVLGMGGLQGEEGDRVDSAPDLFVRLEHAAKTADQLAAVAQYESLQGRHGDAVHRADAAVAADPGYSGALAARARVRFDAGDFAGAVADQEHAIALLPEQVDGRVLVRVLQQYRARAVAGPETR